MFANSAKPVTASNFHLDAYSSDAPSPFTAPDDTPDTPHAPLPSPSPSLSPTPIPTPTPALSLTQSPLPTPSPLPHSAFSIPHSRKHPLLAPGSLSLLLGDPGTGKSLAAIDLAARLSNGTRLPLLNPPGYRARQASSLLLSLEDTPDTIADRFRAAHANLLYLNHLPDRVDLIPPSYGLPKAWLRAQSEPQPSSLIAKLLEYLPLLDHFRLLILDPLPAFLGVYDCSHQGTIRRLLQPLLQLAEERQFAILGISHLAKPASTRSKNPLHRAIGSLGYAALARTVLLVTHDTLTHNPNRRLVIPLKNNHAPLTHAWSFTLQPPPELPDPTDSSPNSQFPFPNSPPPSSVLTWDPTPLTSHPLLNQPSLPADDLPLDSPQLQFAQRFVATMLAHGPIPSAVLYRQASTVGLSRRTVQRARDLLHIDYYHDAAADKWMVTAPTPDPISI